MAANKGRDFLLKVGTTSGTTLAAMTTTSFSISGEAIDVTTKDSPNRTRELLAGSGTVTMSISASGILTGGAQFATMFTAVKAATLDQYTIMFDGGDSVTGTFLITSLEASGEMNGAQTYSVTLESSGDFTFTPGA